MVASRKVSSRETYSKLFMSYIFKFSVQSFISSYLLAKKLYLLCLVGFDSLELSVDSPWRRVARCLSLFASKSQAITRKPGASLHFIHEKNCHRSKFSKMLTHLLWKVLWVEVPKPINISCRLQSTNLFFYHFTLHLSNNLTSKACVIWLDVFAAIPHWDCQLVTVE